MLAPKISAYITTYNRPEKLDLAIKSIINQTLPCLEIIIIDDNSSTDCSHIIKKYSDKNLIKYHKFDKNMGACYARNFAINMATGTYVAGLDDDDQWHPERMELLHNFYVTQKCSFVYADDFFLKNSIVIKITKKPLVANINNMLYENKVGNQIFTEKNIIISAGLFDLKLTSAQDYDMWIRIIKAYGPAKKHPRPLQYIAIGNSDRITFSNKRMSGYFLFYKKYKPMMNLSQKKFQLLNIKYMCSKKISLSTFIKLFDFYMIKRRVRVFISCVITRKSYDY